jgi:hypothetical protein
MPKINQPIKIIKNDLITILEFIRVAVTEFPKATDHILTHMDLSDEAFKETYVMVASAVDFDFDDDGDNDDGSDS